MGVVSTISVPSLVPFISFPSEASVELLDSLDWFGSLDSLSFAVDKFLPREAGVDGMNSLNSGGSSSSE